MTAKLHWTLPKGQRTTFNEDDFDLVVTSNGYVDFRTPAGNRMEVILAFPQLANAIEEERNEWWRESRFSLRSSVARALCRCFGWGGLC